MERKYSVMKEEKSSTLQWRPLLLLFKNYIKNPNFGKCFIFAGSILQQNFKDKMSSILQQSVITSKIFKNWGGWLWVMWFWKIVSGPYKLQLTLLMTGQHYLFKNRVSLFSVLFKYFQKEIIFMPNGFYNDSSPSNVMTKKFIFY